jgi:hypothetical protein
MSAAARDLLRQARFRQAQTEERISHPLCVYNAIGAPTCRACPGVKLDSNSAWLIHVESASHKRNAATWNEANRCAETTASSKAVAERATTIQTDSIPIVSSSVLVASSTTTKSTPATVAAVEPAVVSVAAQLPPGFFDADIAAAEDEKAARLDAEFEEFAEAVRDKLEATGDADLVADAAVAVASELEQSQAKIQQLEALKSRFKRARQDGGESTAPIKKPTKQSNADDDDDESEELSDLDDDTWRRRATKK